MHTDCIAVGNADGTTFVTYGASMTTTILMPDSGVDGTTIRNDASGVPSSTADVLREASKASPTGESQVAEAPVPLLAADLPRTMQDPEAGAGMTDDDTVSVLEVLAEMQRIIDRHLDKTGRQAAAERPAE